MGRDALVMQAATYFDGEAYFGTRNRIGATVEVVSCLPESLLRLQRLFGGTLEDVTHHGKRKKKKRAWRWRVTGENARSAALEVLPHLWIKAPEAAAVAYAEQHPAGSYVGDVLRELAARNRLGYPLDENDSTPRR